MSNIEDHYSVCALHGREVCPSCNIDRAVWDGLRQRALNTPQRERMLEALPDADGWVLASTACPECQTRFVVKVRQRLAAKPLGTFSLSGSQVKMPASFKTFWECVNCGAGGDNAEAK